MEEPGDGLVEYIDRGRDQKRRCGHNEPEADRFRLGCSVSERPSCPRSLAEALIKTAKGRCFETVSFDNPPVQQSGRPVYQ